MRFAIHLSEVLEIKVGIDLGGGDIGVAEEFLYGINGVNQWQSMGSE